MTVKNKKRSNEPDYHLQEVDRAGEIAMFYGFTPIKAPRIEKEEDFAEKIAVLKMYVDRSMHTLSHPLMFYYKRPFPGSAQKKISSEHSCGLDILGSSGSICDALIVRAAFSILQDHGHQNIYVSINSVGDKDSINRFERELSSYVRKQQNTMPADLRQRLKKDIFGLLNETEEKSLPFKESAPRPMSYLTDPSISHFKEVLEYLESLEIPYRINHDLVGDRNFCSHTMFEIREEEEGKEENYGVLATGSRHNHISRRFGLKRDIPIVSTSISCKKDIHSGAKPISKILSKPKFYFVQLGNHAKLKSLPVIEMLRKARIPVYHSLTRDKIVGQLSVAENMNLPFVIIMGQKEAFENTVVVRHVLTRVQETIPINELSQYLHSLV